MEQWELPEGWMQTVLDHLLIFLESGSRPKGGVRGILEGIPSIGGEHLNDKGRFNFENVKYIPEEFYNKMKRGHIQIGDILIVKDGATTGKVSLVRSDFPHKTSVVNEHVFVCRLFPSLYSPFVFWFLFSQEGQNNILANFHGGAQGGINQQFAPKTLIPLAPLAEQKRIVAKVEALLAWVNAARERLEKVPAIVKRFRQSVLAAACSGRLTEEWREKKYNYDKVNDELNLPDSWKRIPLKERCKGFQYGSSKKSERQGKIPVLRMGNIQNGEIDWSDLVYTSDEDEIKKYLLKSNTVLFNRTNSPELVGKTAIYRGNRPAIFAGYLIRILHGEKLNPEYLNFCLNTPEFKDFCLFTRTDGVSQSNINAQKLATYEIPWCELEEQQEIVLRVEALFTLANIIESQVKAAKVRIDKLSQAILAKAFRGELVPTEAELARREGREYETAAELLERIQKAKEI